MYVVFAGFLPGSGGVRRWILDVGGAVGDILSRVGRGLGEVFGKRKDWEDGRGDGLCRKF
jgi:hypothetical protein